MNSCFVCGAVAFVNPKTMRCGAHETDMVLELKPLSSCLVCRGVGFTDPKTRRCSVHQEDMVHELKTWPESFQAISFGEKTFEIRKNDRDYKRGDILLLREWSQQHGYSGQTIRARVTYLAHGTWGLPHDLCVMALGVYNFCPKEIFDE